MRYDKGLKWLCRCECGAEKLINASNLKTGNTRSCGCLYRETRQTHGLSKRPEYNTYRAMLGRCLNPSADNYSHYGGRGIRICPEWITSIETFMRDVGPRPSRNHVLDRIDNNGNYEPGNVRWVTPKESARNRRPSWPRKPRPITE